MNEDSCKDSTLTRAQIDERDFLSCVSDVLSGADLSKLDLKTFPGEHRAHSALLENYEINIARTGVYVYKNKLLRALGVGDWKYQEGKFERYEIYVLENSHNMRAADIKRSDCIAAPRKKFNVIMERGTMATNLGYYEASKYELLSIDSEDLFYNQNAHLFMYAKKIYEKLDSEYLRRRFKIREFECPEIKTDSDRRVAHVRVLFALDRAVKKQK